jgi:GH18 family chitinase
MESSMSRLKSLYVGAVSALLVFGITSTAANADHLKFGDRQVAYQYGQYHDGSYIKVGRKGRRNTAIALGAIVLGTMLYNQNQRQNNYQRNYNNNAHVNWCYNRYRSYRAYDNTFQPYHGPRRQCISPYY